MILVFILGVLAGFLIEARRSRFGSGRPPGRTIRPVATAALLAPMLLGFGCGESTERAAAGSNGEEAKPVVAATIHPLAEALRAVAGDRLDVVRLAPPGASPHAFEPRPSDARAAAGALAIFHVSDDMDGWAARLAAKKRIAALGLIDPSRLLHVDESGHAAGDVEGPTHAHGGSLDPHFWLDPLLVRDLLPKLAEELAALDPGGRVEFARNAEAFAVRLDALNAEVASILAPVRGRAVLLFHPSFQYLLRRHGMEMAGCIEPFPGKEPSPKELLRLAKLIEARRAGAVFHEPQFPSGLAANLVEAANRALAERGSTERVALGLLDPIGGVPGRETYEELILFNARALRDALAAPGPRVPSESLSAVSGEALK